MASSMKNIRPKKESRFYTDDSSELQESERQKDMEDKFYKEAAREILRDAVREKQASVPVPEEGQQVSQQVSHAQTVQASQSQAATPVPAQHAVQHEEVQAPAETSSSEFGAGEFDDFELERPDARPATHRRRLGQRH